MKCHYEILGVSMDASDEDLKKNYRRLALKWHPDKNLDNEDEAKEQFQLIQQAFEVLSDPQERAWYDDHREAILKGGLGGDYQDDSFDVFPYYTSSCYKGFGDDEKGFYSVYREVFNKVAAEESDLYDASDSDFEIPGFGDSTSNYEEVVHAFYGFWQSFTTRKSYAWMDEHDTRHAENRRVVRAMEKENKKKRDKAKKERNEQIRALVAFVRKRDKRIEQYKIKLAEKAKENALKAENNRKRQLAERKKMREEYKDPEYLKMEDMEGVLKEIESSLAAEFGESCSGEEVSNSEDEAIPSSFFCVACNKNFKTEKAFANHENSKKHKDNVAALKIVMQNEENLNDVEEDVEDDQQPVVENGDSELCPEGEISDISIEEVSSEEEMVVKKKNRKGKKKVSIIEIESPAVDSEASLDLEDIGMSKKQRRRKQKSKPAVHTMETEVTAEPEVPVESEQIDEGAAAEKKLTASKSKGKKAKAARQQKPMEPIAPDPGVDVSHTCVKCNSSFQSRNKLFDHFKKTGHSVPLASASTTSAKGIEKKKRK